MFGYDYSNLCIQANKSASTFYLDIFLFLWSPTRLFVRNSIRALFKLHLAAWMFRSPSRSVRLCCLSHTHLELHLCEKFSFESFWLVRELVSLCCYAHSRCVMCVNLGDLWLLILRRNPCVSCSKTITDRIRGLSVKVYKIWFCERCS